jgi:hypothetical protein
MKAIIQYLERIYLAFIKSKSQRLLKCYRRVFEVEVLKVFVAAHQSIIS